MSNIIIHKVAKPGDSKTLCGVIQPRNTATTIDLVTCKKCVDTHEKEQYANTARAGEENISL